MASGITFSEGLDFGGSAVSSLFGAEGDAAEAKAYKQAASYALTNAAIEEESTKIQETQAQRQIFQNLGAQQTAAAGGNLKTAGSALDIYRSSVQQGALQKQLIQEQGLINETSYKEAAAQYTGMANAATAASTGGFLSGIVKGVGAIAGIFGL